MLSGGDYDCDKAWVCWDPRIVKNFHNAPVPRMPDLVGKGYLRKWNPTFSSLVATQDVEAACGEFLHLALSFSMEPSFLGRCTKFKERLCYAEGSVSSERAVALSTLVGLLVDQSKQGLVFTQANYKQLVGDMEMKGKDPEYEKDRSSRFQNKDGSIHVLDFLKFVVAHETIERCLSNFSTALFPEKRIPREAEIPQWDTDLAQLYEEFDGPRREPKKSVTFDKLMRFLIGKVEEMRDEWKKTIIGDINDSSNSEYREKVDGLYRKWLAIEPPRELRNSKAVTGLFDKWSKDPTTSRWAMLKASVMFKLCYKSAYIMVWRLAGHQLALMKASRSRSSTSASFVPVTMGMWSVLRPDQKRIRVLDVQRQIGHDDETATVLEEVAEYDEYGSQIDDA